MAEFNKPTHYPEWLDREKYPFNGSYFQIGDQRLHYVDVGEGDPIVMVHGNPTWSFLYRRFIKDLSRTHRCIAPDHLGFGLSDKPVGWSYKPAAHAANLAALLDELDLNDITLVVQDWGGPIGLSYALDHPYKIKRLVVMNTWCWPVDNDRHYRLFSGLIGGPIGRLLIRRFNFFVNVIMKGAYGERSRLSHKIHRHYKRPLNTPAARQGSAIFPGEIIGSTTWLRSLWERRAAMAAKPALILWGSKDIAFREKERQRFEGLFANHRSIVFDDCGHYVQEEKPTESISAIRQFIL